MKEYGEKKKLLTTPPQPLKEKQESVEDEPAAEIGLPREPLPQPRPRIATSAFSRVEPPEPDEPQAPPPPPADSSRPAPSIQKLPALDEEITAADLDEELLYEDSDYESDYEIESEEREVPLYLGRRAASLLIDNSVLILLHTGLLYLCAEIISYSLHDLFVEAALPLTAVFLLFHCLYYVYFFKTSRQTPGQVFFGLELRDPLAGGISLRKVFLRWICLVALNIFNLVPVFMGRRFLILDRVSGTQIHTLK